MNLTFTLGTPQEFPLADKQAFAKLLAEQRINRPPYMDRVNKAAFLLLAKLDDTAIAICSIHPLFQGALAKAGIEDRVATPLELGHLYVRPEANGYSARGMALGHFISNLLIHTARQRGILEGIEHLYATSQNEAQHPGYKFLERLGFQKIGSPYAGSVTGLPIATWALEVAVPQEKELALA